MIKVSQGWNQVVSFEKTTPVKVEELEPEDRAAHEWCRFFNVFAEEFNQASLPAKLKTMAMWTLVAHSFMFAGLASLVTRQRLPMVEPNQFKIMGDDGERYPLYHLNDTPEEQTREDGTGEAIAIDPKDSTPI